MRHPQGEGWAGGTGGRCPLFPGLCPEHCKTQGCPRLRLWEHSWLRAVCLAMGGTEGGHPPDYSLCPLPAQLGSARCKNPKEKLREPLHKVRGTLLNFLPEAISHCPRAPKENSCAWSKGATSSRKRDIVCPQQSPRRELSRSPSCLNLENGVSAAGHPTTAQGLLRGCSPNPRSGAASQHSCAMQQLCFLSN